MDLIYTHLKNDTPTVKILLKLYLCDNDDDGGSISNIPTLRSLLILMSSQFPWSLHWFVLLRALALLLIGHPHCPLLVPTVGNCDGLVLLKIITCMTRWSQARYVPHNPTIIILLSTGAPVTGQAFVFVWEFSLEESKGFVFALVPSTKYLGWS